MIIKKHKFFDKSYSKLNDKIKWKVKEILMIFENDCFNKKLNNHALKWVFLWFRSINVTWNYRIIFRELSNNTYEIVELINVWTHSELYK
jgi:mRNA-degrading endonuclease YafQ of YafQ-DinJ toxin-antitoxin module